jgi:drug/metabolite transporter (DMT)-like permease
LSQRTKAELLLVAVTLIWGSTFVIVKAALNDASPFAFNAARFIFAGILLFLFLSRGIVDREALLPGLVLGLFLFGGYAFQTSGLKLTTPSKAAFITGFSVVLVPLIMIPYGYRMRLWNVAGALLGLAGIYLLVLPSALVAVNRGDILTLVGAVSFAVHIVLVGKYTQRHSFQHLVPVQILVVGLLALAVTPFDPGYMLHWTVRLVVTLIVTAVFPTCVAFSVQNWAQQYTPPAHTALIFALEPVFAAVTSRIVMGEHLGGKVLLGCLLILGGMVVSEIWGGSPPSPVEG